MAPADTIYLAQLNPTYSNAYGSGVSVSIKQYGIIVVSTIDIERNITVTTSSVRMIPSGIVRCGFFTSSPDAQIESNPSRFSQFNQLQSVPIQFKIFLSLPM
jgi:hypothetical protein